MTFHFADIEDYTEANALLVMMIMASVLRGLQETWEFIEPRMRGVRHLVIHRCLVRRLIAPTVSEAASSSLWCLTSRLGPTRILSPASAFNVVISAPSLLSRIPACGVATRQHGTSLRVE